MQNPAQLQDHWEREPEEPEFRAEQPKREQPGVQCRLLSGPSNGSLGFTWRLSESYVVALLVVIGVFRFVDLAPKHTDLDTETITCPRHSKCHKQIRVINRVRNTSVSKLRGGQILTLLIRRLPRLPKA